MDAQVHDLCDDDRQQQKQEPTRSGALAPMRFNHHDSSHRRHRSLSTSTRSEAASRASSSPSESSTFTHDAPRIAFPHLVTPPTDRDATSSQNPLVVASFAGQKPNSSQQLSLNENSSLRRQRHQQQQQQGNTHRRPVLNNVNSAAPTAEIYAVTVADFQRQRNDSGGAQNGSTWDEDDEAAAGRHVFPSALDNLWQPMYRGFAHQVMEREFLVFFVLPCRNAKILCLAATLVMVLRFLINVRTVLPTAANVFYIVTIVDWLLAALLFHLVFDSREAGSNDDRFSVGDEGSAALLHTGTAATVADSRQTTFDSDAVVRGPGDFNNDEQFGSSIERSATSFTQPQQDGSLIDTTRAVSHKGPSEVTASLEEALRAAHLKMLVIECAADQKKQRSLRFQEQRQPELGILDASDTHRGAIRRAARYVELIPLLLFIGALFAGWGSLIGKGQCDPQYLGTASSLPEVHPGPQPAPPPPPSVDFFCTHSIQLEGVVLIAVINTVFLAPMRMRLLAPLLLIMCALYFGMWFAPLIHFPFDGAYFWSSVVIFSTEFVCVAAFSFHREWCARKSFILALERLRRVQEISRLQDVSKRLANARLPLDMLSELRLIKGGNASTASEPPFSSSYSSSNSSGRVWGWSDSFVFGVASLVGFEEWAAEKGPSDVVDVLRAVVDTFERCRDCLWKNPKLTAAAIFPNHSLSGRDGRSMRDDGEEGRGRREASTSRPAAPAAAAALQDQFINLIRSDCFGDSYGVFATCGGKRNSNGARSMETTMLLVSTVTSFFVVSMQRCIARLHHERHIKRVAMGRQHHETRLSFFDEHVVDLPMRLVTCVNVGEGGIMYAESTKNVSAVGPVVTDTVASLDRAKLELVKVNGRNRNINNAPRIAVEEPVVPGVASTSDVPQSPPEEETPYMTLLLSQRSATALLKMADHHDVSAQSFIIALLEESPIVKPSSFSPLRSQKPPGVSTTTPRGGVPSTRRRLPHLPPLEATTRLECKVLPCETTNKPHINDNDNNNNDIEPLVTELPLFGHLDVGGLTTGPALLAENRGASSAGSGHGALVGIDNISSVSASHLHDSPSRLRQGSTLQTDRVKQAYEHSAAERSSSPPGSPASFKVSNTHRPSPTVLDAASGAAAVAADLNIDTHGKVAGRLEMRNENFQWRFCDAATETEYWNSVYHEFSESGTLWRKLTVVMSFVALMATCLLDDVTTVGNVKAPLLWCVIGIVAVGVTVLSGSVFLRVGVVDDTSEEETEGKPRFSKLVIALNVLAHQVAVVCYAVAIVVSPSGSIIAQSQIVWLAVQSNWMITRGQWFPWYVSWVFDLVIGTLSLIRTIYLVKPEGLAKSYSILFSVVYMLYALPLRAFAEREQRFSFSRRQFVVYLAEEIEEEHRQIEDAFHSTFPAVVARLLVRRTRTTVEKAVAKNLLLASNNPAHHRSSSDSAAGHGALTTRNNHNTNNNYDSASTVTRGGGGPQSPAPTAAAGGGGAVVASPKLLRARPQQIQKQEDAPFDVAVKDSMFAFLEIRPCEEQWSNCGGCRGGSLEDRSGAAATATAATAAQTVVGESLLASAIPPPSLQAYGNRELSSLHSLSTPTNSGALFDMHIAANATTQRVNSQKPSTTTTPPLTAGLSGASAAEWLMSNHTCTTSTPPFAANTTTSSFHVSNPPPLPLPLHKYQVDLTACTLSILRDLRDRLHPDVEIIKTDGRLILLMVRRSALPTGGGRIVADEVELAVTLKAFTLGVARYLRREPSLQFRMLAAMGPLMGAVTGTTSLTFEYFGCATLMAMRTLRAMEWGSIAMTSRLQRMCSYHTRKKSYSLNSNEWMLLLSPSYPMTVESDGGGGGGGGLSSPSAEGGGGGKNEASSNSDGDFTTDDDGSVPLRVQGLPFSVRIVFLNGHQHRLSDNIPLPATTLFKHPRGGSGHNDALMTKQPRPHSTQAKGRSSPQHIRLPTFQRVPPPTL